LSMSLFFATLSIVCYGQTLYMWCYELI
jgi:hypothetical protein